MFKTKVLRYFKSRRINVFILFAVFALLISLLSKLSKEYTVTLELDIQPTGVPEEYVVNTDSIIKLEITVSSFGFDLLPYYFKEKKINLDFTNIERTDRFYLWTKERGLSSIVNHFDKSIKIETINQDSIRFNYDINAVKVIPVQLNSQVVFSPGYDIIDSFKLSPDSIKIIGPKTALDTIHFIKTALFAEENINTNILSIIELEIPNNFNGLSLSEESVSISGIVEKFTEGTIDVPIVIKNIPKGLSLNYYPKKVAVYYYTSLTEIKSITEDSFTIECDYLDINEQDSFLVPQLVNSPDNIKNARLDTKRIEFILTE